MPHPKGGYRKADGTKVPSVTTLLEELGWGKEGLMWWAWDLGCRGFDYRKAKGEAADVGTVVHDRIECDLHNRAFDQTPYQPEHLVDSDEPFDLYLSWKKGHEIVPLFAEEGLVSEIHGYAGTPDLKVLLDGVPTDIDVKTGKRVYPKNIVQVAAYDWLYQECRPDLPRAQRWIILRPGRDRTFEVFDRTTVQMIDAAFLAFLETLKIRELRLTIEEALAWDSKRGETGRSSKPKSKTRSSD